MAPSVISNNYLGAKNLTQRILSKNKSQTSINEALIFIGGREHDHNTRERIRGFIDAHNEKGITVPQENILACGYAPKKLKEHSHSFLNRIMMIHRK